MPVPKEGESRSDFISRCIPFVIHEGTTKDPKQAAAICHSIWRKHHPGAKAEKASDVQALIFDKPKFNRQSAIRWARGHGFKTYTDRETENTIRLRQFPPEKCLRSGGMKQLEEGVQAYICPTASKVKSEINEIKSQLIEVKKKIK